MNYVEWNNVLGNHFFNSNNAGKEVFLYLTKKEIINLGYGYFEEDTEEIIWNDYIKCIRKGIPGSYGNIIDKAKSSYDKRKLTGLNGYEIKYPLYINYLVFLIIPLIENINNNDIRANNYYSRLNSLLKAHNIEADIGSSDFRKNSINDLWEDLELWANIQNNGDLGMFKVIPFSNRNWVYVGKIFSQCVLPPKYINRLSELFEIIGLVPDSYYDDEYLKDKIKNTRTNLIPKHTLDFLRKNDELAHSIIQTIQRQYRQWTGETHEDIEEGINIRKKRNFTLAPLFLQFKVNTNDEIIKFSYRMYSSNDYPEDLKFDNYENLYELNGWSKTLPLEFNEDLELKDNFNRWIAKFPNRDVRLFISASTRQLSNDFWIETEVLSKTDRMYLLCKNEKQRTIENWGLTFCKGNFKKEDLEGLPENYSLFWFHSPIQSLKEISILTLYTEKRVELIGGLNVNFRTYTNDFIPEVEIVNSEGDENVYLQYKGTNKTIFLSKKTPLNNHWLLPRQMAMNTDFYIKIENDNFSGNAIAYNITSPNNTAINIDESKLPKRDSFGRRITTDAEQYCLGSNIINPNTQREKPYRHLFYSIKTDITTQITSAILHCHCGNNLSDFLSLKSVLTTEEFFRAFEFYYSREFPDQQLNSGFNLTKLKRASLNFYDFIGILDYDYETKKIVLNPPQFIFIPTQQGRKIILIGARDSAMIETIINTAPKHNLQVEITEHFKSNERLLLPDVITIKAFQQEKDNYGEKSLKAFADELKIKLVEDSLPQVAFLNFSANISDYEYILQLTDENDYDWARYIFNPETLRFEKSETENFDKSFSLLQYKLNEYTYQHKLWKDNNCYIADLNWGRFIALKHFKKNVILFDSTYNKVAVPIELPLPRLLAESIMLLSGLAPNFRIIEEKKYRIYENIPSIFTQNLFSKLGQYPINKTL